MVTGADGCVASHVMKSLSQAGWTTASVMSVPSIATPIMSCVSQYATSSTSDSAPAKTANAGHAAASPATPHTATANAVDAAMVPVINANATGWRAALGTNHDRWVENSDTSGGQIQQVHQAMGQKQDSRS